MTKRQINWEQIIITIYYLIYIITALGLLFTQHFGAPPDEIARDVIPQYIWAYRKLPNGFDESIRIQSYGFSYAFQPILPYIFQGLAMIAITPFHPSADALLFSARMVDFVFGLVMAHYVLKLSKLLFRDIRAGYLFAFFVMFLPQSLYMHTYVNTDSCCMMSIAIILYGLIRGTKDGFSYRSCIHLSVGIIFCALSYYNAYGFILSSILLFFAFYLSFRSQKPAFDVVPFIKKGAFISVLVLAGISWWFIRSYILYDGDFLGLKTRDLCASMYAIPSVNPLTRITYHNQGYSVLYMLTHSNFFQSSFDSFICAFGALTIVTSIWVYRFYKLLIFGGLFCCIVLPRSKYSSEDRLYSDRSLYQIFFHINMVFCILMPLILSIYYSYTTDYQAQGRYLLPALIPLAYYVVTGVEKGITLLRSLYDKIQKNKPLKDVTFRHLSTGLYIFLGSAISIILLFTVFLVVIPIYVV